MIPLISELLTCPAKVEEICFPADMGADKNLSAFELDIFLKVPEALAGLAPK
jgi:hypothetical protein